MNDFRLVQRGALAIWFLLLCPLHALPQTADRPAATQATGQPARITCKVRVAALSPGELAATRRDLPAAETLLREESHASGPGGDRAHNAVVRVLLREEKFDEAGQEAKAWASSDPRNAWAQVSLAEVQWRDGEVTEAITTINIAARLDTCNARVDADAGAMQAFYGLGGSAKDHLDRAHRLDPVDADINGEWLQFQPRAVKAENLTAFLTNTDLTAEDRRSLEQWKDRMTGAATVERCHLANAVSSTKIPYRAMQDGPNAPTYWGLDVAFNGTQRRLQIDTGAHGLLLTREAANALHLEVENRGKTWGIGDEGAVVSHVSRVHSIRIGALEFQDCTVQILDQNSRGMQAQDGLIGGDVFAEFALTLDFPGHVLMLDPLPPLPGAPSAESTLALDTGADAVEHPARDRYVDPSMKTWTRVFRSGHDLILPVQLNGSLTRLFIVDTGSSLNLINWQMARQIGKVSKGSDIELQGISGKVKETYTTGPVTLLFANIKQPSSGMIGMDTSALSRSIGVSIAGLLGAPTLHQLTVQIDYRDDLINFKYDPKRLTHCVDSIRLADCYN